MSSKNLWVTVEAPACHATPRKLHCHLYRRAVLGQPSSRFASGHGFNPAVSIRASAPSELKMCVIINCLVYTLGLAHCQ